MIEAILTECKKAPSSGFADSTVRCDGMSISTTPFTQHFWQQLWWWLKNPIPTSKGFLKKNKVKESRHLLNPWDIQKVGHACPVDFQVLQQDQGEKIYRTIKIYFRRNVEFKGEVNASKTKPLFKASKTSTSKWLHLYIRTTAGINSFIYFTCHTWNEVMTGTYPASTGKDSIQPLAMATGRCPGVKHNKSNSSA